MDQNSITLRNIIVLHENTKAIVKQIAKSEAQLILSLQQIIQYKVYRHYKYPNLFSYLTLSLGLSESRAYDFSIVARAGLRFRKFNEAVASGRLSVSKARRITSVLTQENEDHWLENARMSTHRQLEKLVASQNPDAGSVESARFVSANQVEVKITMARAKFLHSLCGLASSK